MNINSPAMETLEYSPILIENISHSINIPEGISQEDLIGKVTGKSHYNASYNIEENTLVINIRTELYYQNDLNESILLFHIEVRNIFHVKNLSEYITDNGSTIEPKLLAYLKAISIAQTRGIQSTMISSTPIASMLIPPIRMA